MKYSRKLVLIPEDKYRIITKNPNQQNPAIGDPISKKITETRIYNFIVSKRAGITVKDSHNKLPFFI